MNVIVSGVRPRLIPCLLVRGGAVYTTRRFQAPAYIGDLLNTVRIFNELEVDELMLLDIDATRNRTAPNFRVLTDVASECFMPLSYGGGVTTVEQMAELYAMGIEKVVLNSVLHRRPELLSVAAARFGRQAVVASIDVGGHPSRPSTASASASTPATTPATTPASTTVNAGSSPYAVMKRDGSARQDTTPILLAKTYAALGAGELLVTSIHQDGSLDGYDTGLISAICAAVDVPVIASGGAGSVLHATQALAAGAQAAAAGSMLVYQRALRSVLVHYPARKEIRAAFAAESVRKAKQS